MKRLTLGVGGCKAGALILRRRKQELPPSGAPIFSIRLREDTLPAIIRISGQEYWIAMLFRLLSKKEIFLTRKRLPNSEKKYWKRRIWKMLWICISNSEERNPELKRC